MKINYVYVSQYDQVWKLTTNTWRRICYKVLFGDGLYNLDSQCPDCCKRLKGSKRSFEKTVVVLEPLDWTPDEWREAYADAMVEGESE